MASWNRKYNLKVIKQNYKPFFVFYTFIAQLNQF